MSKKTVFLLTVFLFQSALFSHEIKPRLGIFFPVDNLFQEIYGIGPTYEVEVTGDLSPSFATWGNFNAYTMNGRSLGGGDPTDILITNFSFGTKIKRTYRFVQGYAGLGCVLSGLFIDNHNTICCKKTSKFAVGGVIKLGLQRYLTRALFLDYFLDYYIQPVKFDTRREVGGWRTGFGLGYGF